jgi:peptide chain release factor
MLSVRSLPGRGPGGQHQNKTESAVRATHIASGLSVVVREERSQHRNKALALERIATLLRLQDEMAAITAQERCTFCA